MYLPLASVVVLRTKKLLALYNSTTIPEIPVSPPFCTPSPLQSKKTVSPNLDNGTNPASKSGLFSPAARVIHTVIPAELASESSAPFPKLAFVNVQPGGSVDISNLT